MRTYIQHHNYQDFFEVIAYDDLSGRYLLILPKHHHASWNGIKYRQDAFDDWKRESLENYILKTGESVPPETIFVMPRQFKLVELTEMENIMVNLLLELNENLL